MKKFIQALIIILVLLNINTFTGNKACAAETDKKITTNAASPKENDIKCMSTTADSKIELTPKYDKSSGLYGYVNKNGKWIIDPVFLDAKPFSQGLAAVLEDSEAPKWGYIQSDGTFAIKAKYTAAYDFKADFAIVTDENFYVSTINKKGEVKEKTKYYMAGYDIETLRAVISDKQTSMGYENIKYGAITDKGEIIKPRFNMAPSNMKDFTYFYNEDSDKNRTYYLVTSKGTLTELPGKIESVSENVGLIEYRNSEQELRYAYVTLNGKVMKSYKEYTFIHAKDFSEGFAVVAINEGTGDPYFDRYGFLKKDGTWLAEPQYKSAGSFKKGVAPVKPFDTWGYIKSDLTWFIDAHIPSEEEQKAEDDYVNSEIKKILKDIINTSMSDYEKVYKIYGYITKTVSYDNENYDTNNIPRVSYSPYGALKYHIAVCEGYALTIQRMLDAVGIENTYVAGPVKNSGVPHAWNLVKIGGNYYNMDATWDAEQDTWSYFLRSDNFFSKSRTWDKDKYPAAPKDYK